MENNRKEVYAERMDLLKEKLDEAGCDCFIAVNSDEHSSEYICSRYKLIEYLTGFSGSNAVLTVTQSGAFLRTDGRYFIQAAIELDGTGVTLVKDGEPGVPGLAEFIAADSASCGHDEYRLFFDRRTVSFAMSSEISSALGAAGTKYTVTDAFDIADSVWPNRPALPKGEIWPLALRFCGVGTAEKLSSLRAEIKRIGGETIPEASLLIAAPDETAWLMNFRSSDIEYTPVALAFTLVTSDSAVIYTDGIIPDPLLEKLSDVGVSVRPYASVYGDVSNVFGASDSAPLIMDPADVNDLLASSAAHPIFAESPVKPAKAVKNPIECKNIRAAHVRDGVALTKLIYILKNKKVLENAGMSETVPVTESDVSRALLELRGAQEGFISPSFETIAATAENAAIVHYEPSPSNSRPIENGFLLIDSGGQYLEGTTDVTRTVSVAGFGGSLPALTEEMREHYTAVLKGHLAIAMSEFPEGTECHSFDAQARRPIQAFGLDYKHGTGHGVGYLLSVHEGPNAIRKAEGTGGIMLPGMVTSDEPGIYLEGKYGIRIENLLLCAYSKTPGILEFESLTLAPYDRDSIIPERLTDCEREYLNSYHRRVLSVLSPYLTDKEIEWLKAETAAL